jgi:hypothetical protein
VKQLKTLAADLSAAARTVILTTMSSTLPRATSLSSHSVGSSAASPSSFRCDLALIPVSLPPAITRVSPKTTTGSTAFGDHSSVMLDLG